MIKTVESHLSMNRETSFFQRSNQPISEFKEQRDSDLVSNVYRLSFYLLMRLNKLPIVVEVGSAESRY